MTPPKPPCIVCSTAQRRDQAEQFAVQTGYPLFDRKQDSYRLQLCFTDDRIKLFDAALGTAIHVDFLRGALAHRQQYGGGKNQPLARALGLHKRGSQQTPLNVLDATAGLARDAWVLATLGCKLTLVEQSPVLFAMIHDGIERALRDGDPEHQVRNFTHLVNSDSQLYLQHLDAGSRPDVIYIDPMYPERKKSALVKKYMQMLHKLIGPAQGSQALLYSARQRAKQRVVVKRPASAEPLAGIEADTQLASKKTRYDIYLVNP